MMQNAPTFNIILAAYRQSNQQDYIVHFICKPIFWRKTVAPKQSK
jgi:hypothetical protein